MRLDSMGKPPLLQVVQEPRKLNSGEGQPLSGSKIKETSETPPQSSFSKSQDQAQLSKILEILAKGKKSSKKKASWAAVQYKKALTYKEAIKIGESLDVSG